MDDWLAKLNPPNAHIRIIKLIVNILVFIFIYNSLIKFKNTNL